MVLYLVGLGLGDEKDITVRGLEIVRRCSKVFLEHYTSILGVDYRRFEEFYRKEIIIADRFMVEDSAEGIFGSALDADVALLVVGDPLCATTHTDMMIRARQMGVQVQVVHNASVMGAVASCGLQLYQFGQTVSIPFFDGNWRPDSFYDKIKYNMGGKMHTLVLLDIKVKEPDFDAMKLNQTKFFPPRFMTVNQAIAQLFEVESKRQEQVCMYQTLAIGCARLGHPTQQIVAGTLADLLLVDFGEPLHCLVLCSDLHELELDFLAGFMTGSASAEAVEEAVTLARVQVEQLTNRANGEEEVEEEDRGALETLTTPDTTTQLTNTLSSLTLTTPVLIGGEAHTLLNTRVMDDDDVSELLGLSTEDISGAAIVSDDEE